MREDDEQAGSNPSRPDSPHCCRVAGRQQWRPARQDSRSRRAPAGRTLLPTTRRPAAGAPTSPERTVSRGEEAPCNEVATPDSWYWSASSGALGGRDPDTSSVPHQAATVDLQRAGVRDPRQRTVPRRGATATTLDQTRHTARSQYESQPRPQRYFQGGGDESQHRDWTAARFLRGFAG